MPRIVWEYPFAGYIIRVDHGNDETELRDRRGVILERFESEQAALDYVRDQVHEHQ